MSEQKVWSQFEVRRQDSIVKLKFQKVLRERYNEVIDFYVKYLLPEETIAKSAGINDNPEAILEYKTIIHEMSHDENIDIVVCTDEAYPEEIVAASLMVHSLSSQSERALDELVEKIKAQIQTQELKIFFAILKVLVDLDTPFKKRFKSYYDGRGIMVRPDYRNLGIASRIVKLRREITETHNVCMTCAWMTSLGTQIAAERDHWVTAAEISTEELSKQLGIKIVTTAPTMKFMAAIVSKSDT